MDCKSAHHLLEFSRPGGYDLAAEECAALDAHLAICPDCDCLARAERQFDAQAGQAIRDVPVPQGFRDRLLSKLRRERDNWWKQWLNRGMRYAAAAAAVLLLIWGGLRWKASHLDQPTTDDLLQAPLTAYEYSPSTAEDAEKWFKDKGRRVAAPRDFDYRYLASYSMVPFEFRSKVHEVPQLLFVRSSPQHPPESVAQVFILSSKQFNLGSLEEKVVGPAGYRVRVVVDPRGEEAYVIAYTGDLDKLKQQAE